MLIECGGQDKPVDDVGADVAVNGVGFDYAAMYAETNARAIETRRATKLALLELLQQHGVAKLQAHADGSGDSGQLESVDCYVEPSPGEWEACETPEGVEAMVDAIVDATNVSFDNDGGFVNLTITTATRECELEVGWYYTESDSNTTTETL